MKRKKKGRAAVLPEIASAILTKAPIWTLDKKLKEVSSKLGISLS